jgi:hypothetical protein
MSPEYDGKTMWQVTNVGNKNCERELIDLMAGIRLTNINEHPTQVTDIRVESATAAGEWIGLKRLFFGKTYLMRADAVLELSLQQLDKLLAANILYPHEPALGLLLLQYPRKPGVAYNPDRLRLTVIDSKGSEGIELPFFEAPLQQFSFRVAGPADLSGCSVVGPDALLLARPKPETQK